MQVHGNEITVQRGESWTMNKKIQNRDGSPYIISSEFTNPYWLVTVASSRYDQKNRYVLNKWLDLKDFPRFKYVQPVKLLDYDLTFEDGTFPGVDLDSDGKGDFHGDKSLGYANVAIFYEKDSNGVISYKYWEYINNEENDYDGRWVDYKCPIITSFSSEITSQWIEQSYYYEIRLVEGLSLSDYLRNTAGALGIDVSDFSTDLRKIYESIKVVDEKLVENINDFNKPLVDDYNSFPILSPTKLSVYSNLI